MSELPEFIDGLPNISGWDREREEATHRGRDRPVFLHESGIDFGRARGACAVVLPRHQPLIPAGGPGRGTAAHREPLVGNLQSLMQTRRADADRRTSALDRRHAAATGDRRFRVRRTLADFGQALSSAALHNWY